MGRAAQAFTKTPSHPSFSVFSSNSSEQKQNQRHQIQNETLKCFGFRPCVGNHSSDIDTRGGIKVDPTSSWSPGQEGDGMGGGRGIRAKMANRKSKKGGRGRKRSRKARRGKNGRRRGRQDEIPEADVASDDGGSGDGGDVCEVLMFGRGDGTYSLKFVQNKCE